jgi:hypothetical protein
MRCIECEEAHAEFDDPRSPPYGEGKCLCKPCAMEAHSQAWSELDDQQENLKYNYKFLFGEEFEI